MELTSGIKIVADKSIKLAERLNINAGVENAAGYDYYNEYTYLPGAAKPQKNWRNLSATEFSVLTGYDSSNDFSNTICIKPLPSSITKIATEIGLSKVKTLQELNELFNNNYDLVVSLNEKIKEFMESLLMESRNDLLEFRALCVTKPKLETLAFDNVQPPKYLGLHIDVSKGVDFSETSLSFNRICISFGSEKRELLIINKTIAEICAMLKQKIPALDIKSLTERQLVRLFFDYYPDYPVVKLTQLPHELYIAPTDNIIHDGSTFNNTEMDVVLHVRGYFDPLAVN